MKILFIGNSYTYFNDMPALFGAECEKKGVPADVKSVTAGGYMLSQFLSDDDEYGRRVKQLLRDEKFDYVVMQEQSVLPATDPAAFLKSVSELTALIRKNGAKPVLYQTWGRADGCETLDRLGMTHDGRYMRQADYATPREALQVLTGGAARWNLWLFLVRRDLVERHHIRFVPGADLGEDMQFILRAFLFAERVVQLHEALYRYNAVSTTSISRGFTLAKRAQIEKNLTEFAHDFAHTAYGVESPQTITELKLYLKRPLLISPDRSDYETWYSWFPEVNAHATEGASLPAHTRILQGMAARRNWLGVKMYYLLVHKMVYGIFYR